MTTIFSLVTGFSLSGYIRKRKLTKAVWYLKNGERVIDVAVRFGYDSPTSFSRAFFQFHKVKPSKVKNDLKNLRGQVILNFKEQQACEGIINYQIVKQKALTLYGIKEECDINNVPKTAERLWKVFGHQDLLRYGLITKEINDYFYWCTVLEKEPGYKQVIVEEGTFFVSWCNDLKGRNIKKLHNLIMEKYVPALGKKVKTLESLEVYRDGRCEIWIRI